MQPLKMPRLVFQQLPAKQSRFLQISRQPALKRSSVQTLLNR
jgi:hypothetical protein